MLRSGDGAAAKGISSPGLYAFGCKEALFLEAVDLYTQVEAVGV